MTGEVTGSCGDWIRQRRRIFDLTQAELARFVGCAVITIRKIERDEQRPPRQMAQLLAEYLTIPEEQVKAFLRMARGEYVIRQEFPQQPARLTPFLEKPAEPFRAKADAFVARENELSQLASREDDARNHYARAQALFDDMHARPDLDRVRTYLTMLA